MSGWRLVDLCAYYVRLIALAAILAAAFATAPYSHWPAQISTSIASPLALPLHGARELARRSRGNAPGGHKDALLVAR